MTTEQMDFYDLEGIVSQLRRGAVLKIIVRNLDSTPGNTLDVVVADVSSDTGTIYFNPFNPDGHLHLINIRDIFAMGMIK